ncbi:MAG: thermonuclease family protein [Pleurocapsa sp.]
MTNSKNLGLIPKLLICACITLFFFGCSFAEEINPAIAARVERNISGQTLEVSLPNSENLTQVRIIGIDAPDLRQSPWGKAAQERLAVLQEQSVQLELESETPDSFDRLLAHVWHNKSLVSEQLIKEGFVSANTKYPHKYSQRLLDAQEYARLMGYGIWNPQQPMRQTPYQFRSQPTAK